MSLNPDQYDIIIVGGGPSGCMAALTAARSGVSVIVLEKDREIGIPVRCAEAVGQDGLDLLLDEPIPRQCIATTIRRFRFIAPNGTVVYPQVNMTGFVLNRKLFDLELARRAALAGARILTGACATGLLMDGAQVRGVRTLYLGEILEIKAKIVIGADGVESRVGRWAGLNTTIPLKDMETCCQYLIANVAVDDDTCEFYFSQENFPGGYAWVFPKGNNTANIGLGIAGNKSSPKTAAARLYDFITKNFPDSRILEKTVGGVPCAPRIKKICTGGLLLTGDAAWQSNPVSGGGIITGMHGGMEAGRTAAEAVLKNDFSESELKIYEKRWDHAGGRAQHRYYRLKEGIRKLSDKQLNETARVVSEIPQADQTLSKIFQTALIKQPSLLIDILKVISPFS